MILEHVGLTVDDLGRSIDFYTRVLGFRVLRKTPMNAYLYMGEDLLELMQRTPPRQGLANGDAPWMERLLGSVGLNHIGFRVEDLDAAIEELKSGGGTIVIPPFEFAPDVEFVAETDSEKLRRAAQPIGRASWRIAVIEDSDGTLLELLER